MKKYTNGCVYMRGSKVTLNNRCIYTDGIKTFIKWGGQYIEVNNRWGIGKITSGWFSVEEY